VASAPVENAPRASSSPKKQEPIGQASMKADRSIVLDLFKPAHLQTTYAPSHPEYKKILDHVGPLEPGQQKLVMPWPDDIDDAKVESAVRTWAAGKKWSEGTYKFEITGTAKDGNIAVSVVRSADAGGKGLTQLLLDPKTYAVAKETPFP
jgi:hypothetical protein